MALFVSGSAMAADMPVKATPPAVESFSWTGLYLGINAGYQTAKSTFSVPGGGPTATTDGIDPQGFSIGGQAGYRYQFMSNIVVGAEAREFFNSGTKRSAQIGPFANSGVLETDSGGDLRLMLGYAFGRLLPYAAGGLAWSNLSGCTTSGVNGPCATNTFISETRVGTTIGGGLAYAFTNHIVGSVDYTYSRFGTSSNTTIGVVGADTDVKLTTTGIRGTLSYKF